jgi:hypothetical protein
MELADLTLEGRQVDGVVTVPGGYTIRFRAQHIDQTRTGLHAKLFLGVNQTLAAYSYFNVERDEERGRLANSAHRKYPEALQALYPKEQLKHDLDIFTTLIWPKYVEGLTPSPVAGFREKTLPEFVLTPYITRGGGTIIFGPPERMKTMTALTMAISIDAGTAFPFEVERAPVMYVNLTVSPTP